MTAAAPPLTPTDARRFFDRLARDPALFAERVMGVRLWGAQRQIVEAVRDHKRVAVASGHSIGKTHVLGQVLIPWFLFTHRPSRVLSTSTTAFQVRDRLWAEVHRGYDNARVDLGPRPLLTSWQLAPGWEAVGISTNSPDNFQGGHEEHVLILFDEAQGIDRPIWLAAESMLTSDTTKILATGNPLYTTGDFHGCFHRHRARWHCVNLSCEEHPNVVAEDAGEEIPYPAAVTRGWIEEMRDAYGEDSPIFVSRVLGQFPAEGENTLIPQRLLEMNAERRLQNHSDLHLGVDIARFGSDSNVAILLRGREVAELTSWRGIDTMATVGRIQYLIRKHDVDPRNVHVDVIGVGAGVVDRLRELDVHVDGVGFGDGPAGDWRRVCGPKAQFKNRRAELYWVLRQLLRQKGLVIPRRFGALWEQLTQIRYFVDPRDRIAIEKKDDLKERLGRSPDEADALTLALARAGSVKPWVMTL